MFATLRASILMLLLFTAATGVLYPVAVTGIAIVVFPHQRGGSLIIHEGRRVGSSLVGQPFDAPRYFWSRPSATGPTPYNAAASSGSNLGPLNPALADGVRTRVDALRSADPQNTAPVPVDLATASGSGLDPHISPAAAEYQVGRVARERGLAESTVRSLVAVHTLDRQWFLLGEPCVEVLPLNIALDAAKP